MNGLASPILSVRNLSVRFGALVAVDDVSFDAAAGCVTSVIGPNGAGKSTLFNLISGALAPTAGSMHFAGRDVSGKSPPAMLAAGLSRSFQITNLFFDLTVFENLRLAAQFLEPGARVLQPVGRSERARARVSHLIERFSLDAKAGELAGHLSHGEQRRLEIAVALASEPKMLLLDEPTQGMSHADTRETADLIRSLVGDVSILLIEHDVDLVMDLSDHVIVMAQGRKIAEGTAREVRGNRAVQVAYFGEARGADAT